VNVECEPGLVCDEREGCQRPTPENSSEAPSLPPPTREPATGDAGKTDAIVAADPGADAGDEDASSEDACAGDRACNPGDVETSSAGCQPGTFRRRECKVDCTWTNFSTTCS
jgi:hypothetical protein